VTKSGAPARGAIVALRSTSIAQNGDMQTRWRVIDAGSGHGCQSEPVAHFGLGAWGGGRIQIVVSFASGAESILTGPAVDTEITVREPAVPAKA
jgi:hypothetical protein